MMKKNSLTFSVFGVLALLTLMSLVSAAVPVLTLTTSPATLTKFDTSTTFTVTSSISVTFTDTFPKTVTLTDTESNVISLQIALASSTATSATFNVNTLSISPDFNLGTYSNSLVINAKDVSSTDTSNISISLSFQNTPNEEADNGNLNIDDLDVFVENGFGDDTEWYPLDEIRVNVDLSNDGNDEIRNIVVEWGLYDRQNARWVIDEEESDFDLDEDDEQTLEFTFKLDNMNRLEDNGDYTFYVWATGDDKETDNKTSTFSSLEIDVTMDSHFVILDSLELVGTASCGDTVQVSGEVWNIGDDDEEDVYFKVFNTLLGISQTVEVGDIDSFESKDLLFNVVIPEDAEEGSYDLSFLVYDDSNDLYESSNGDESEFTLPLNIASGSCSLDVPAVVTANLETAARAGEEFTVRATVTNTASIRKTFTFEIGGYTDWATFVSVDKPSLTLDAGKSTDVLIKLKVNEGVSGSKNFNIIMEEGSKTLTQPVSVPVTGIGFSITGLFAGLGGNAYLWAIGALNVLLVLIIIIVAVRVIRKKQ